MTTPETGNLKTRLRLNVDDDIALVLAAAADQLNCTVSDFIESLAKDEARFHLETRLRERHENNPADYDAALARFEKQIKGSGPAIQNAVRHRIPKGTDSLEFGGTVVTWANQTRVDNLLSLAVADLSEVQKSIVDVLSLSKGAGEDDGHDGSLHYNEIVEGVAHDLFREVGDRGMNPSNILQHIKRLPQFIKQPRNENGKILRGRYVLRSHTEQNNIRYAGLAIHEILNFHRAQDMLRWSKENGDKAPPKNSNEYQATRFNETVLHKLISDATFTLPDRDGKKREIFRYPDISEEEVYDTLWGLNLAVWGNIKDEGWALEFQSFSTAGKD